MSSFFNNPASFLLGIDNIVKQEQKVSNIIDENIIEDTAVNDSNLSKQERLDILRASFSECNKCGLAFTRTNIVFGDGDADTRLMFIGEGPGADEDAQGLPFVGRSGQLLTKMINAMGLSRQQVYIANIVKCRPPANRDPLMEEAQACIGYLRSQIQIINPEIIVCLGSISLNFLLQPEGKVKLGISKLRGTWQDFYGYKVLPTFHPAYLLRNPSKKREAWHDLQVVMKELGLEVQKSGE